MNLRKYVLLVVVTYGMCALWAITGSKISSDTTQTPSERPKITLSMLSPEQLHDRAEALIATTTSTTTSTTSTIPPTTIAPVAVETKCQEWFPIAVSVGWPNDTKTLQKLGLLIWEQSRCLNIVKGEPHWNGHDWGPTQINYTAHHKWVEELFNMPFEESMSDPTLNLRFAFLLYNSRIEAGKCGWKPWSLC